MGKKNRILVGKKKGILVEKRKDLRGKTDGFFMRRNEYLCKTRRGNE